MLNNFSDVFSATRLRIALAITVTGVLALLVGLAGFAHPSGDDFCYAAKTMALGFVESQRYAYEAVNGRYTATAGISGFALLGRLTQVYWVAPVMLLLTFAAFAFLVSVVARDRFSRGDLVLAAGVLTVVYFSTTPDPAQTFYWLSGALAYQLGNVLFVVLAALLVVLETRPHAGITARVALFAAASTLAIAAIGTNEVSLVLTLMALACGTSIAVRKRRTTRPFWLALSAMALVAAAISVLAPGNFIRAATIGAGADGQLRPDAFWAAVAYVPWVVLRMLYWLSNVAVWASSFLLFFVTRDFVVPIMRPNGTFERKLLLIPAAWLCTIFVLHAIGFVANRYPLPERAESVVNLAFLLGWYPSFVILAHWKSGAGGLDAMRGARIAAIALIVGLLGSPTIFEAYKDVYRGYRYDSEMDSRWEVIRGAARSGVADVVLPSLSRTPRTLFATDFFTDPVKNACAADYFGIESIRLGAP